MSDDARLWAEFNAARADMRPIDRNLLVDHGITPGVGTLLVGTAPITLNADRTLYEPDGGVFSTDAFISPVMIEHADTPESASPAQAVRFGQLIDLVAWHPAAPERYALRTGAAEWLGAIEPQYLDPEPVVIHRGVLSWLQARATGLVLLGQEPMSRWRVLSACASLQAQGEKHAKELRKALRLPGPVPTVHA